MKRSIKVCFSLTIILLLILGMFDPTYAQISRPKALKEYGGFKVGSDLPKPMPWTSDAIKTSNAQWKKTIPKPITKAEKLYDKAIITANYAEILCGKESSDFLYHYLNNTGGAYSINFSKMIKESKNAKKNRDDAVVAAKAAAEKLCAKDGKLTAVSKEEKEDNFISPLDSVNWYLVSHHYRTITRFTVNKKSSNYTMRMTYYFKDFYDYSDKVFQDYINIGAVNSADLNMLNRYGRAKAYEIQGSVYYEITWKQGSKYYNLKEL